MAAAGLACRETAGTPEPPAGTPEGTRPVHQWTAGQSGMRKHSSKALVQSTQCMRTAPSGGTPKQGGRAAGTLRHTTASQRRPHRPPTSAGSAAAAAPRARPAGRAAAPPSPGRAGPLAARPARPARARCRSAPSPRQTRPRAGRLRERGLLSARARVRVHACLPHATLQSL
jgi:hypothetical protein